LADSASIRNFGVNWTRPNLARIRFHGGIPRGKEIRVEINAERVYDIYRNRMPDSVVSFSFSLPPADTVGSVRAVLVSDAGGPFMGVLAPMDNGNSLQSIF